MQRQELLTTLVLANAFKEGGLTLGGTCDEKELLGSAPGEEPLH